MSKLSHSILTVLLGTLAFAPAALPAQGTPYADPQHRFTVQVPGGWTSRDLAEEGVMFNGPGVWLQVIPTAETGSLPEVIASLMEQINRSWRDLQEYDRRELTITGQQTAWVIYNGTDFAGTPGTVRVMAVKGGGTMVGVIISGERNRYTAERGTFEAILATLRLGTNPPVTITTYPTTAGAANTPPALLAPQSAAASKSGGMGLEVRDVDDDDVGQLLLADDDGVVVSRVLQGGPAGQAGIRENDVITQVDRSPVDGTAAFERLVGMHQPGDSVELLVTRNGRRRTVSVRLEVAP